MLQLNAKDFLKSIQHRPGVYQMLNEQREVLYVGKAKDLRQRLANYFRCTGQHPRTLHFLAKVVEITTIVTANEAEALLLEYSLIKALKPRYNILLKDDKSFPFLFLSQHQYPLLAIYRGPQKAQGSYFGPFYNGYAVHETLSLLQKIFKLRKCTDNIFKSRSRPCLQYQIGRCSAPCVGNISVAEYMRQVEFVKMFLSGKSQIIIKDITQLMMLASKELEFEKAAVYREQLKALKAVQQQQHLIQGHGDFDVMAIVAAAGHFCIDVLTVRNGMILGNKSFCEACLDFVDLSEILLTFLVQYYLQSTSELITTATQGELHKPHHLILNINLSNDARATLVEALTAESLTTKTITVETTLTVDNLTATTASPKKLKILCAPNSKRYQQWLKLAQTNAEHNLQHRFMVNADLMADFKELQQALSLNTVPKRIACFDVSHHGGEATVVACVVFTVAGALKEEYRRYNIKSVEIAAGDDYGALREGLRRHFMRIVQSSSSEPESESDFGSASLLSKLPDVLLIDGGKGQLQVAMEVLAELGIQNKYKKYQHDKHENSENTSDGNIVLAIAKGEDRKVGAEKIYAAQYTKQNLEIVPVTLPIRAFSLVLRIRDEAHRFAITTQRSNLRRTRLTSMLENVPGIGKKKRDLLLQHFGGWQEIKAASIEELCQVPGINAKLAQSIYEYVRRDL